MSLMLCSCSMEPDDAAYIVAIGFDKGEEENYKITLQFAKPNSISGGSSEEGGKSGGDIVENIAVEAPNMYSAINTANNIVSKTLSLSHTKLAVFSGEVAEEGLEPIIDTMIRSEEIKPDLFVAVAKDGAGEYLKSISPAMEVNPAKYYQLIYQDSSSYAIPRTNLKSFYLDEKLKTKNSVMPLAGTNTLEDNKEIKKTNEKSADAPVNEEGFEYKIKDSEAGQVLLDGNIKSEAAGMAVFEGDKAIANLGAVECEIYNILSGKMKKGYISFKSSLADEPVTVKITKTKSPKYRIDKENKKIEVDLYMESDLYSIPAEINSEEKLNTFENEANADMEKGCEKFIEKLRDEYNAETLGFGIELRKKFLTNKGFREYNFRDDFKNYQVKVNSDIKIRRTGMKYR